MDNLTTPATTNPIPLAMPITANDHRQIPDMEACCSVGSVCRTGGCMLRRTIWSLTAAILILGTLALGYWFGTGSRTSDADQWKFPATVDATAAASSDKFSIATGAVGDEAEGLFVLDHNSGLLQCSVMYPRLGKFLGMFTINVGEALATSGKGGTYIMVTGFADFPRASNRAIGANTIIYVLNTATGDYAAYAIPFDRVAQTAGRAQQGALVLLATGQANPVIDRDNLR